MPLRLFLDGGSDIYDNLIDMGSGEYSGRGHMSCGNGIRHGTWFTTTSSKFRHCQISRSMKASILGGHYGIQLEGVGNVEVFDNQIYAFANRRQAHTPFVANSVSGGIYVHDNELHAISNGPAVASLIKLGIDRRGTKFASKTIIFSQTTGSLVVPYWHNFTSLRSTLIGG